MRPKPIVNLPATENLTRFGRAAWPAMSSTSAQARPRKCVEAVSLPRVAGLPLYESSAVAPLCGALHQLLYPPSIHTYNFFGP